MAVTPATMPAVLCLSSRPQTTRVLAGVRPETQCAAVTTLSPLTRLPPQNWEPLVLDRNTVHGYWLIVAREPPTTNGVTSADEGTLVNRPTTAAMAATTVNFTRRCRVFATGVLPSGKGGTQGISIMANTRQPLRGLRLRFHS